MKICREKIINFIFSLLSTLAFCYLCSLDITNPYIFLILFVGILFFYLNIDNKKDINISILSIILCFLLLLGKYSIYMYESNGIELWIKVLITPIGFYILIKRLCIILFEKLDRIKFVKNDGIFSHKKIFVLSFIVILICWIPVWVAEYPGIIPADTLAQINQALGKFKFNNANPLIHTLFLKIIYSFLSLFNMSINNMTFVVSFIQMIINSLIYAYVICYIYKKTHSKFLTILSLLFYSLISYNVFYNITISKDSAYAAFLSLFVVAIDKYFDNTTKKNAVVLIIVGILYSLMRSNGYYTLLFVLLILVVFTLMKKYQKITITLLITFIITTTIRFPIYNSLLNTMNNNIEKNAVSTKEKKKERIGNNGYQFKGNFLYIVPFQQVANVVVHERELNEKEEWLIEEYIPLEKVKEVYNPILVDPLFSYIENHFQKSRGDISNFEYFKLWIELFLKYPLDYVEAYVNMNKYYFYPNRYVKMYVTEIANNKLGIEYDGTISSSYKQEVEKVYDAQKDMPIIAPIFCPGVITFVLIIALFYTFRKNKKSFICLLPILGNFLVLMAFVPLNDEFRYYYPIAAALPLIIMQVIKKETNLKGDNDEN